MSCDRTPAKQNRNSTKAAKTLNLGHVRNCKEESIKNEYVKEEAEEYVINGIDNPLNQNTPLNEEDNNTTIEKQFKTRTSTYDHCNIYLQQVPRKSRCNVQLSFEGVYDNETSGIVPLANQQVRSVTKSSKDGYLDLDCLSLPIGWKIVLGLLGFILVSGAVVSWVIALTEVREEGISIC